MAGRMGSDTVTTQNVTVHAVDAEQGPDPAQGRRPRPQGRPRRPPLGRQEATAEGGLSMATKSQDRQGRPARRDLRRRGQHPADPPGRRGPAGRCPPGHARHQARGEVRGGGRKPYKQKGTGRARQGSTRAPQFAGGGVVHGPQPRNYDQRTPKKMKAAALRGALSDRARNGRIHVVDALVSGRQARRPRPRSPRWPRLTDRARFLVVLERSDALTWLSLRNAPEVHIVAVDQLNTYDVLAVRRRGLHPGRLRRVRGRPAGSRKAAHDRAEEADK